MDNYSKEFVEKTYSTVENLVIVNILGRFILFGAYLKWTKASTLFLPWILFYWFLQGMAPTDKGETFTDSIIILNGLCQFMVLYIDFPSSFIITLTYLASVLFIVDPMLYEQELNSFNIFAKAMYFGYGVLAMVIMGMGMTLIYQLQTRLSTQAKEYFSLLNLINSGLVVISLGP